jgi:hypothetical protein
MLLDGYRFRAASFRFSSQLISICKLEFGNANKKTATLLYKFSFYQANNK